MQCRIVITFASALLALLGAPAQAESVHVTDGDTIRIDDVTYRLWGIDAPETNQWCGTYPAGWFATATLEHLIKGHTVTCEYRGYDRYGRVIGLCRADGRDLGAEMVRLGMAYAFVKYSRDYVEEERLAERERLGFHPYDCERPWDWREHARKPSSR